MDEAKKSQLLAAGIDLDSALERFMGKESMLERYLGRFLEDKSFAALRLAAESGDRENARVSVHTLKSVCGSIGCSEMQALAIEQEKLMRAEQWDDAFAMMPQLAEAYDRVCSAIRG